VKVVLYILVNPAKEMLEIFLVDQVKEAVDIVEMEEIMEMFRVESSVDQEQVEVVAAAAEVEVVTMAAMLLKLIIIIKLNFYNDIYLHNIEYIVLLLTIQSNKNKIWL
jgi:hypothetical protein